MLIYIVFAFYITEGSFFQDILGKKENNCINATVTFKFSIKNIAYRHSFQRNAIKITILMKNARNSKKKGNITL